MLQDDEWDFFMEGIWEYQWTKTSVSFSEEINEAFYHECQGIIDIAIKLYKMVQWRAISLGNDEKITVDLIRQTAKDGLYLVKPMLDAIRSGDREWMLKYKDIAPLDPTESYNQCLSDLEAKDLKEIRRLARKQQANTVSPKLNPIIIELLKLDVEPSKAKECAETAIASSEDNEDVPSLVRKAYTLALGGEAFKVNSEKTATPKKKTKRKYQTNDIRQIVENAKNNQTSAYEGLKSVGIIKEPVEDFIQNY